MTRAFLSWVVAVLSVGGPMLASAQSTDNVPVPIYPPLEVRAANQLTAIALERVSLQLRIEGLIGTDAATLRRAWEATVARPDPHELSEGLSSTARRLFAFIETRLAANAALTTADRSLVMSRLADARRLMAFTTAADIDRAPAFARALEALALADPAAPRVPLDNIATDVAQWMATDLARSVAPIPRPAGRPEALAPLTPPQAAGGVTPQGASSAQFLGEDSTTGGDWERLGFTESQAIARDTTSRVLWLTVNNAYYYSWGAGDARALSSPTGREATAWYTFSGMDFDLRFQDRSTRRVGLYVLDYDDLKRSERIDVVSIDTGEVLDSRVVSNFRGGRYLIWSITGPVKFKIIPTGGPNGVVSAVLVGAGTPAGATAEPGANLALRKPTTTSSRSAYSTASETGAVDGVKDGRFGFHTGHEPNPWWEVDLQQLATLSEIRVFNNRENAMVAERAATLRALVSVDGLSWRQVHAQNGTFGMDGQPLRIMVGGIQARYVRLQLGAPNYLHLDEVEVYGISGVAGGGAQGTQPGRPSDAIFMGTERGALGRSWEVVELGIRSVWTRRGVGNVFDVEWPGLRGTADVLLSGNRLVMDRRDDAGLRCRYEGTVDGATAQGVFSCTNGATNVPWSATIR